jgi:hypothetical protein
MGVALENARLFDETQHLLKETEQRNAELAVINAIQQGMAASLDFRAIIDLVGAKLEEVFGTGDISIRWLDARTGNIRFFYEWSTGKRFERSDRPPSESPMWRRLAGDACAGGTQHARRARAAWASRRSRGPTPRSPRSAYRSSSASA